MGWRKELVRAWAWYQSWSLWPSIVSGWGVGRMLNHLPAATTGLPASLDLSILICQRK